MNFIRYWLSTESETVSSPFGDLIMAKAFEIDASNQSRERKMLITCETWWKYQYDNWVSLNRRCIWKPHRSVS